MLIGTSGREVTKVGRSDISEAALSVPARWSRRLHSASIQSAFLRQPHKQVALTNIFVGQHCAVAFVAKILAECSQRPAF